MFWRIDLRVWVSESGIQQNYKQELLVSGKGSRWIFNQVEMYDIFWVLSLNNGDNLNNPRGKIIYKKMTMISGSSSGNHILSLFKQLHLTNTIYFTFANIQQDDFNSSS